MKLSAALFVLSAALPFALGTLEGPIIKERTTKNNNAANNCKTKVSIDCIEVDVNGDPVLENGKTKTCFSARHPHSKKAWVPNMWFPEEECGETYFARVTFKMCNENTENNKTIVLSKTKDQNSYQRIRNQDVGTPDTIPPNECKEKVLEKVELVKCKSTPISIQLQGNMPALQGNSFCYNFVFNKGITRKIPEVKIISPAPVYELDCVEKSKNRIGEFNGNECYSSVKMTCAYDGDKSCIGPGKTHLFYNIPLEDCLNNPINNVKIQQAMCNKNKDSAILLNSKKSFFRVMGKDDNDAEPTTLPADDCAVSSRTISINTCKKAVPMGVKLEGTMDNAPNPGNAFCYCYMFKKGLIEQYPGLVPTQAPTKYLIYFITEIVFPTGADAMRYIEIYSPNGAGEVIDADVQLVRYLGTSRSYDETIPLKGLAFDANGYLLLCRNPDKYQACNPNRRILKMLRDLGDNGATYAIINRTTKAVIDSYGVVGSGRKDFFRGRVYRKKNVVLANPTFDIDEWIIESQDDEDIDIATPGCWVGAGDISRCFPVAPTISPAPSSGKGKGEKPTGKTKGGVDTTPKTPKDPKETQDAQPSPAGKGKGTKKPTARARRNRRRV